MAPLVLLAAAAMAEEPFARTESREPCAHRDPLRRPFFGDNHVHTRFSFDAWGQGTLAGPREAYRFARGEAIGMQPYDTEGRAGDTRDGAAAASSASRCIRAPSTPSCRAHSRAECQPSACSRTIAPPSSSSPSSTA